MNPPIPTSPTPELPNSLTFPRFPGETPRAFSAFVAFLQLGHNRSLPAVAKYLGEKHPTIKYWSAKYHWSERINAFNSGLLQEQVEAEAAARRQHAADWSRRTNEYDEQEWDAAQKLLTAAQCFLENVGDREVEKMTLAQASRALEVSSRIARQALSSAAAREATALSPLQLDLAAALKKVYGQHPVSTADPIAHEVSANIPDSSTNASGASDEKTQNGQFRYSPV